MPKTKKSKKQTLTKKVNKLIKVMKVNAPETKYAWDYGTKSIDNNPTACIFPYRLVSIGTTDVANRIGDEINIKHFNMKGFFSLPATYAGSIVRVVAFIYKSNPDAAITSIATIINLYLESTTMNTNQAVNAFLDWDNHTSFATLYDKKFAINQQANNIQTQRPFDLSLKIPSKYRRVEYSNGGIYPCSNELVIAFLSDSDSLVAYYEAHRITYTDA